MTSPNPLRLGVVQFLAALQFLTILPPIVRRRFTSAEVGGSLVFFPVVGLLIGAGLAGLFRVLESFLPIPVASALVLVAWVVVTGGLHVDGFLDSCDALLGGGDIEERLKIFRDERVGSFAVVGGVLLFLVQFAALSTASAPASALLAAPILGRWMAAMAIAQYPYCRTDGLAKAMKDHADRRVYTIVVVVGALAVFLAPSASWPFLDRIVAVGGSAIVANAVALFAIRRLPGLTGDLYGAIVVLTEATVLVTFCRL